MSKTLALTACLALTGPIAAPAQHDPDHHSQYAHQQDSGIAALSLQELQDLESGAGMGMARAAELNHYPGPKHVLELAEELGITAAQREKVEQIRLQMSEAAKRLGAEIVELERQLDRRFEHQHIDEPTLRGLTAEIAALQGDLRATHLVAHLRTSGVLEREQVEAYDKLRGYGER